MSTGQIIFLGIGIVLVLSSFDFSSLLKRLEKKANEIDIPNITPAPAPAPAPIAPVDTKDNLVEIVQKWQSFKDACEENNLSEAVITLDEIFPMLIKVDK
jgi:hypothetical protein